MISNTQSEIKIPLITSDDEYIVKDYNAAKIKKPSKGETHVALTNKRALIYYWTNDGILVNDAGISDILVTKYIITSLQIPTTCRTRSPPSPCW